MYRLLIVDDEAIIVNGLYEYFTKRDLPDVDIVLAYSPAEALSILSSVKVDVVLSDICMPRMNGMELLSNIEMQWPRCKVILLTGHDEFDYVHQALRSSCVMDYILKTEGMERIRLAVDKALQAVKDELAVYHQKEWLQQELPKAISQLQRQLLLDVLRRTDAQAFREVQTEFDALKLPLKSEQPVLMIWFSVEDWGKYHASSERDLMLFGIGNIAEEQLGSRAVIKCVQYDHQSIIGFVQWKEQPFMTGTKQAELLTNFTHGTLEVIQQVCRDLFQIPVSAAASRSFVPFDALYQEVQRLRLSILNKSSLGIERLTILPDVTEEVLSKGEQSDRLTAQYVLEKLQQSILEEQHGEWAQQYEKLMMLFPEEGPVDPFDRMLISQLMCKHAMVCVEELGLKDQAISQANLLGMLQFNHTTTWQEILVYFQNLLEWVQQRKGDHLRLQESSLIGRIHYFIQNNLHGDLSLTRIAREVSLNPSYLSRWYKQTCKKGLSDYIQEIRIERAKELLLTTTSKNHEISEQLGFTDPHYFFRFFKKLIGCTPQEYRNKQITK